MSRDGAPAIVTIGNFDGVHLGHQMLLRQVVDRARALGVGSYAVTFHPHPAQVLMPERKLTQLTSPEERLLLMQQCGLDDIWTCAFTPELARLEPEEFIRLVSERQPIAELWVGPDFALGRGRRGTIAVLSEMGGAAGWALHMVPPYRHEGQIVSSSGIRTLLSAGAVRGAGDLLGRPYSLSGELDSQGIVRVNPLHQLPRPGVYAGQARQPGTILDATITVLPTPGELQLTYLDPTDGLPSGPTHIDFLRRGD
jgi:riboflavin kinase / FMN adenylyltransferase